MIGTRIGHYQIVERIPGGGMAEVFRAVQLSLNRTVVIKVPRPELAESPQHVARFRREAETLARLEHENIVRIYDIEEHDCRLFIVMEYVGGGSLEQLLRREGRLEPERARGIAAEVADALAAAHAQRIVHRDIKPGNILFTSRGRPKLADFGIARMLNATSNTTSLLLGTPHYMSPEQVRAETLSPASDVYALGVVLYEMLSGEVPFDAETPFAVAMKHVQERPRALEEIAAHTPAPLCRVVARAMAKSTDARYRDGAAIRDALSAAGRGTGCPECGGALQPGFVTCPSCGMALRRFCGQCGLPLDARTAACPACSAVRSALPGTPVPSSPQKARPVEAAPQTDQPHPAARQLASPAARQPRSAAHPGGAARIGVRMPDPRPASLVIAAGVVFLSAAAAVAMYSAPDGRDVPPTVVLNERVPGDDAAPSPIGGVLEDLVPGDGSAAWRREAEEFAPPPAPAEQPTEPRGQPMEDRTAAPPRHSEPVPPAERPRREPTRQEMPREPQPREPQPRESTPQLPAPPREAEPAAPAPGPAPPFNAEAARQEIMGIIERQRRGTEAGDLTVLLRDVAASLHPAMTGEWRRMQRHHGTGSVTSRVSNISINVRSADQAEASFRTVLAHVRRSDGAASELTNTTVTWQLTRTDGRWLITRASASR